MTINQNIVPHLWFDKEANEAATFYASVFPDSKVSNVVTLNDTPSGDAHLVNFQLMGQRFMAISAGPYFKFNPSISFFVNFDPSKDENAYEKIDEVWEKLLDGGKVLMPLEEYPFSKRYGWVQDKYGLSWQLILTNPDGEARPNIVPSLLFVGEQYGKAEEVLAFYTKIFNQSKKGHIAHYPAGMDPNKEGTIMFADFMLENEWFAAMDSGLEHDFTFNEAVSFLVYCSSQNEIDYYWEKLSAVPEAEQCGWLKDQFGVSWQIVPREMETMMKNSTSEQMNLVNQAVLKMKKLDIAELQSVFKES